MARVVKKAEERRLEIIRTARALFSRKGYDSTTMQDVMVELDIAKGTIYHYFKSKEDLLEAVIEDIVDENIVFRQEQLQRLQGSTMEKFRAFVETGDVAGSHEDITEQMHQPGNAGMHIRLLAKMLLKQAPLYAELIRQGCEEGIFKTEYPLACAEFILAAVQFLTDYGIYPWPQEDMQRRAQAFPALIEDMLQAERGTFDFLLEHMR